MNRKIHPRSALKKLQLQTSLQDQKNKPFLYSLGLHLLLVAGLIFAAMYHQEIFSFGNAVRSPQQVQIVNASLVLPEPSLSKVITPTPPAPAPTTPAPQLIKPTPQVTQKPTPPTPKSMPKSAPKPAPTPAKVAPKEQIKQKTTKMQTQKQAQASELQKQQALQKLKALGLSSINETITTQQKEASSAAQAAQILSMEEKYMGLIQQTIRSNWINQFDPNAKLTAVLKITLDQNGKVLSVSVASSSGNSAFDRQAVLAVQKSSPLPLPPDPDLAKKFMNLILPFNNQDLQ